MVEAGVGKQQSSSSETKGQFFEKGHLEGLTLTSLWHSTVPVVLVVLQPRKTMQTGVSARAGADGPMCSLSRYPLFLLWLQRRVVKNIGCKYSLANGLESG